MIVHSVRVHMNVCTICVQSKCVRIHINYQLYCNILLFETPYCRNSQKCASQRARWAGRNTAILRYTAMSYCLQWLDVRNSKNNIIHMRASHVCAPILRAHIYAHTFMCAHLACAILWDTAQMQVSYVWRTIWNAHMCQTAHLVSNTLQCLTVWDGFLQKIAKCAFQRECLSVGTGEM